MTYRKTMSEAIREVQEATIKPYVSISSGGQYNVLDKDSKVVFSTRDGKLANAYLKKNYDKLKAEEVQESASQVQVKRDGKGNFNLMFRGKEIGYYHKSGSKYMVYYDKDGDDYDQSDEVSTEMQAKKLAYDNMNEEIQEEVSLQEISDKLKLAVLKKKIKQYKDKVFKKTMSTIKSPLFAGYEDVEEGRMKDIFTADQEGKSAEEIAKIMKLPLKTVKGILGEEVFEEQILEFTSDMIKRLQKSYSTMPKKISPEQAKALSKHLDRLDLASLKQLTKANIPFVTGLARNKVYKKTGKFEEIEEQSSNDIMNKAKEFGVTAKMTSKGIDISGFKTQAGMDKFMKYIASQGGSMINLAKMGMKRNFEAVEEPKQDMPDDKEKVAKENSEKEIASLKDQIQMLKTKLENEKNKAVKPEPNPKTGEVPLTVGVAYKHFKDEEDKEKKQEVSETVSIKAYKNAVDPSKKGLMISKSGGMSGTIMIKDKKELKDLETKLAQAKRLYNIKEMKKDDAYAIGMAQAKKSMNDEPPLDKKTITKGHEIAKKILKKEDRRIYVESMAGLKKKSDKSGMPYSILKKVFDRGMAAWKTGHRPGASQQQWAYARVNSFITKSSGTWGGADKDLAKQVKG